MNPGAEILAGAGFSFEVEVLRPDDLLVLRFAFTNMQLDPDDAGRLIRIDPTQDALVVITFQPQHVQEQVFREHRADGTPQPLAPPPVIAVAARTSRLGFRLPTTITKLELSLDALLDWTGWEPHLAANALPAEPSAAELALRTLPREPDGTQTSIELPYRLALSPLDGGRWAHARTPQDRGGRVELWHTRLAGLDQAGNVVESETVEHAIRAVWTPDWSAADVVSRPTAWPAIEPHEPQSLEPAGRVEIVRLSADFGLAVRNGYYPAAPAAARYLMLTALGGWLDVKGRWPIPANVTAMPGHVGFQEKFEPNAKIQVLEDQYVADTVAHTQLPQPPGQAPSPVGGAKLVDQIDDIVSELGGFLHAEPNLGEVGWVQRVRAGRDEYVEFQQPGLLWPLGHLASLITVTERKFEEFNPSGNPAESRVGAYLRQRSFIKVTQPVRNYRASTGAFPHAKRELPFTEVRFTTLVTPDLDEPPIPVSPFFPTIGGPSSPYDFSLLARDHEDRPLALAGPLLFVPFDTSIPIADSIAKAAQPWRDAAQSRKTASARPAPVAFAEVDLGSEKSGVTTAICHSLVWDVATSTAVGVPPGEAPLLPAMARATVSVPALAQVAGAAAGAQQGDVCFPALYLDHGFNGGNPSHLFLGVVSTPLAAAAAPERSGGVASPSFGVEALSKAFGPVGDAAGIGAGSFDPGAFLPTAKLFGAIDLRDLIVTGLSWPNPEAVYPAELRGLTPEALRNKLDDPAIRLKVPVLARREVIEDGKPVAVESLYGWKPDITRPPAGGILTLDLAADAELVLTVEGYAPAPGGAAKPSSRVAGRLTGFALDFAEVIRIQFKRFAFTSEDRSRLDVQVDGVDVIFHGALSFVQTVQEILPSDGFSDPPFLTVLPTGITAGYTLDIPTLGIGVISIEGLALGASVSLPFTGDPAGVRFAISSREHPFLVTVALFGGGGFFAFAVSTKGPPQVEAAIEFGGNFSLDIGVASGNVHVMAGIYFKMLGSQVKLSGYLRLGGSVSVLGIVTVSVEFYLALTYDDGKAYGEASLSVSVEIFGLSKSVRLHVEKKFAGAAGDPTFGELVDSPAWHEYCDAFAPVPE